jgi:hypothetical protein
MISKYSFQVFCLLTVFSAPLLQAQQPEPVRPIYGNIYLSPSGSDTNPGTKVLPFKTLTRARDVVRSFRSRMTGDIIVHLAGGIYPITKTIVFGPEDSGVGNFQIIYMAMPGEKPVLSGGIPVAGWTLHEGNIWQAPLKRDHKLRSLYVNDKRAFMAKIERIPAQGPAGEYEVKAGQAPWAWVSGKEADGVKFLAKDVPEITRNPEDVEIENRCSWNKNIVCVREITTEGDDRILKFQQPYGAIAQVPGWGAGYKTEGEQTIQNAYEFLKEPGQFYFDKTAQMVYYIPRDGEDMTKAEVYAPTTDTLIELRGKAKDQHVRNLTFQGLTFAYDDYNLFELAGSHGNATLQTSTIITAFANTNWHEDLYRSYDVIPGTIVANEVDHIQFIRNTIIHGGSDGIVMSNDINDSQIVGNLIQDVGGGAVTLGSPQHTFENDTPDLKAPDGAGIDKEKYPAGTEFIPRHVLVSNNFLPEDALLFPGHTILTVFYAEDVRLEHNSIPSAPYSGISFGWGWQNMNGSDRATLRNKPTTDAKNNAIIANRVENTLRQLNDGGGIYTLGDQPGTVINRNYVYNTEAGIYCDEGSGSISLHQNVIRQANNQYARDGQQIHNLLIDSYFVTNSNWNTFSHTAKIVNATICPDAKWPMEAYKIIQESGVQPAFWDMVPETLRGPLADQVFTSNLVVQPGASIPIRPLKDETVAYWFAPGGSTSFSAGDAMTTAPGKDLAILAPTKEGDYHFFVVDSSGKASPASSGILTVTSTSPKISGAEDGKTYANSVILTFDGNGLLNGKPFLSGMEVSRNGSYIFTTTNAIGLTAKVSFKLSMPQTVVQASTATPYGNASVGPSDYSVDGKAIINMDTQVGSGAKFENLPKANRLIVGYEQFGADGSYLVYVNDQKVGTINCPYRSSALGLPTEAGMDVNIPQGATLKLEKTQENRCPSIDYIMLLNTKPQGT